MRRPLLICLGLAALTVGVYWPVRTHDFILYDDPDFVTRNPQVQAGLTSQTLTYAFHATIAGNWHPVTTLSHALDCELFGVDPGAHHLVNVAIHAANAVLLFLLLSRLTGFAWRSAVIAALFALHPLRVESVAWIAERKDVLSGFFFMLTLLAYAKYVSSLKSKVSRLEAGNSAFRIAHSALWYALSLLLFALGLMSKPMLVTLPFILLLLDYWPLDRFHLSPLNSQPSTATTPPFQHSIIPLLREKLPFFGLSALCCWVTLRAQVTEYAVRTANDMGLGARVANAFVSYYLYLAKTFWPTRLAVLYPHPGLHYPVRDAWPDWQIGAAALLLLAISALCLTQLRRRPWLAVGWSWYLGTLMPVIGVVQVGAQAMADRYTYLPLIGPIVALVWELSQFSKTQAAARLTLSGAAIASLAACVILTRNQLGYWQDTVALMEHTVAVTPDNPSAQNNLACALLLQDKPSQAAVRFRVATAIEPDLPQAHYALGELLKSHGLWKAAADQFLAATRVATNAYLGHLGLATVLPHLGQTREAAAQMREVLRLKAQPPPDTLNDLAWLLATNPRAEERDGAAAVSFAEKACQITHYEVPVIVGTLAAAYAEAGRFQEATATAETAIAIATAANQNELAEKNRQLLELYRSGRSYRDTNAGVVPGELPGQGTRPN